MRVDDQEVFPLGQAHQASAQEGAVHEVEAMKQFLLNNLVPGCVLLGFRQRVQIVKTQAQR